MAETDSDKLTLLSFAIGSITGVFAFVILFPFLGEGWALEAAGIVFLMFFILTFVIGTAFPG